MSLKKDLHLAALPDGTKAPDHDLPEILICGRSNVGKSTLVNRLIGAQVARTSRTPGRTQLVHLFLWKKVRAVLVDVPGIGFTKAPIPVRKKLQRMVEQTISNRASLSGVLLLIDVRRTPGDMERQLLDLALQRGLRVFIVVTKSDTLPKHKVKPACDKIAKWSGLHPGDVVGVSTKKGSGIEKLSDMVVRLLRTIQPVLDPPSDPNPEDIVGDT